MLIPIMPHRPNHARAGSAHTIHGWASAAAGGGEVEMCHFSVAIYLDTDELRFIGDSWLQAFDDV